MTTSRLRLIEAVFLASLVTVAATAAPGVSAAKSTVAAEPPSWMQPGSPVARGSDHTATPLPDGKVLVVGGLAAGAAGVSELFDPQDGTWSLAPGLPSERRDYHVATALADGRVLVTGGYGAPRLSAEADVFDAGTRVWSPAAPMATARISHTATVLADGRVLVAGGLFQGPDGRFSYSDSAELYDPVSDTWTVTGTMAAPRAEHTATLLPGGLVLVTGGHRATSRMEPGLQDADLFDPATGTWTVLPVLMATGRAAHTATLLEDGRVLLAGGSMRKDHGGGGNAIPLTELFDPVSTTFSPGPPLSDARYSHSAALISGGRVLVTGGFSGENDERKVNPVGSAEVLDPATGVWTRTPPPPVAASSPADRELRVFRLGGNHSATRLSRHPCGADCDRVLIVGGPDGATAQVYAAPPAAPATVGNGGGEDGVPWMPIGAAGLGVGVVTAGVVAARRRHRRRHRRPALWSR